ncbi:hypothetical protein OEV98_13215 [Caldibacillus lycopersici]|uniref:Uncharacterized protein n=1 Tax=Perspicuibacillus lycopersici TaxID=1325689 RepID=A0AAE3LRD1_9BACI|nr:hypothetical protein [Perspicuibacillus lycopersici]MCU9614499.1 hypothetical protein [Perspicuibacillus lycopersici]
MSFTSTIMAIVLFLVFLSIIVASTLRKRKSGTNNKLSFIGIVIFALQILVFALFFMDKLANLNEVSIDILWWATVLCGLIYGMMEIKNYVIIATLTILLSILLAMLKLLMVFITSM